MALLITTQLQRLFFLTLTILFSPVHVTCLLSRISREFPPQIRTSVRDSTLVEPVWLCRYSSKQRAGSQFRHTVLAVKKDKDEFQELLEKAETLRKEIKDFEEQKKEAEENERRKIQLAETEQELYRTRYSAIIPILKPDGTTQEERCDFSPKRTDGSIYITVCEAPLPLGIVIGESEEFSGTSVVDEVAEGSNGEMAGIQVEDIIHACTACKVEMELPTWQLLAGGIGVPKTKRFMYQADGRPFEEVMEAVRSNRQDPEERPVLFVMERREN